MPALTKAQKATRATYKLVCQKKGVSCLALCGGASIRKRQRIAKETADAARVAAVERSLVAAQVRVRGCSRGAYRYLPARPLSHACNII